MMNLLQKFGLIVGICCLAAPLSTPLSACIHPAGENEVNESEYRAIVMHADEMQKIYLRPGVDMDGEDVDIAWVIPTPTRPRDVKLASLAFVEWVESELAIKKIRQPRARSKVRSRNQGALEVSEPFEVGPYQMQSVEATGEEGASQLSRWLEDNGFGIIEGPVVDYYVDNGWSFTTVKSNLSAGNDDEDQILQPLTLEFATPTPVVPTKLMAAKSDVLVKVWYITDAELAEDDFKHANRTFKLEVAPDRRKGSDWSIASDDWVLGRESLFASQLGSRPLVLEEIRSVYPSANRIWVYGLAGEVTPRIAKRAREDLFIGPRKTSLDMTEYTYSGPEEESSASDAGTAAQAEEDAGAVDEDGPAEAEEAPSFVDEIAVDGGIDWTSVLGIAALAFFGLMVMGVQIRRMR